MGIKNVNLIITLTALWTGHITDLFRFVFLVFSTTKYNNNNKLLDRDSRCLVADTSFSILLFIITLFIIYLGT